MVKKILITVFILVIAGVCTAVYMWNKPHQKVEDMKGIGISAPQLAQECKSDEKAADAKYLNKAIEVSGTVSEIDKNQDGGIMVVLGTGDPMAGIQCSMRDKGTNVTKGQNVAIKGKYSGKILDDIALTDCVIK